MYFFPVNQIRRKGILYDALTRSIWFLIYSECAYIRQQCSINWQRCVQSREIIGQERAWHKTQRGGNINRGSEWPNLSLFCTCSTASGALVPRPFTTPEALKHCSDLTVPMPVVMRTNCNFITVCRKRTPEGSRVVVFTTLEQRLWGGRAGRNLRLIN